MHTDLIKRLHSTRLTQGEVRSLAAHLPAGDDELRELIQSLAASADEAGMTPLMLAMVAGGRTIEAQWLPDVLPLLHALPEVAVVALHAQGEVVDEVLAAVDKGLMGWEREAVLLLVAGWNCLNREPKQELPGDLISKARILAREVEGAQASSLPLFVLAHIANNKALQTVLEEQVNPPPPEVIQFALDMIILKPLADPMAILPEQMDRVLHTDGPMRRAVEKVGRNDPCPCGSGKKYKKCCYEKDQERLHQSSDVAGVTTGELDEMPEPFLTREKIDAMRGPKLAHLRIEHVPPPLQRLVLERLELFAQHDALCAAWEKIVWRDDLRVAYENSVTYASHSGHRETLVRLMAVRGITADHDALGINGRLLLAKADPAEILSLLEGVALDSLESGNTLECEDAVCALVESHYPALGILMARGAATTATDYNADFLFEQIGKTRDRLNLPPEDPADWLLDHIFDVSGDELDDNVRQELANARRQMEIKSAEASRLNSQLAETRAQLERQERLASRNKTAPAEPVTQNTPSSNTEADVAKLRARVDELKSALKERHAERNSLRRQLGEAMKETTELREAGDAAKPSATASDADHEDTALLAEESATLQPVRLPEFPSKFAQTLGAFPDNVRRTALALIGRLAAGEPAAFAGMRRLRVSHEICRVRVARDYRLLFKLQSGRLEILDLINRRDFEKWLKLVV